MNKSRHQISRERAGQVKLGVTILAIYACLTLVRLALGIY